MILALIVLLPVCIGVIWAFFRFKPPAAASTQGNIFNLSALAVALLLCAGYSYRMYASLKNTVDFSWWPILAGLGFLALFPLTLGISAALRHFIFYRRR